MKIEVYNDPSWPWWRRTLRSASLSLEVQGAIALLRLIAWIVLVALVTVAVVLYVQRAVNDSRPQQITVYYTDERSGTSTPSG